MNTTFRFFSVEKAFPEAQWRNAPRNAMVSKAFHEAAHAVAAASLGLRVIKLSITKNAGCCIVHVPGWNNQESDLPSARYNLLIAIAPESYFRVGHWHRHPKAWCHYDDARAEMCAEFIDCKDPWREIVEAKRIMECLFKKKAYSSAVNRLAKRLLRRPHLCSVEIRECLIMLRPTTMIRRYATHHVET